MEGFISTPSRIFTPKNFLKLSVLGLLLLLVPSGPARADLHFGIISAVKRALRFYPSATPTVPSAPTATLTSTISATATDSPTVTPTNSPVNTPTQTPTATPTDSPSNTPTHTPTHTPTNC